ncbi:hypothetical protein [Serratia aquatilis]|uniref:Secreted protein n=1 Tax=Serratia aquatilis TaxID=1737515 RepID=A0ABV6EDY3_9GAMM
MMEVRCLLGLTWCKTVQIVDILAFSIVAVGTQQIIAARFVMSINCIASHYYQNNRYAQEDHIYLLKINFEFKLA